MRLWVTKGPCSDVQGVTRSLGTAIRKAKKSHPAAKWERISGGLCGGGDSYTLLGREPAHPMCREFNKERILFFTFSRHLLTASPDIAR